MACRHMAPAHFLELRFDCGADGDSYAAAGVKPATGRGMNGAGDIAFQKYSFALCRRVGNRDCAEQRLRIWMEHVIVDLTLITDFQYFPQIHNRYTVGNMFHDGQIV